MQFGVPYSHFLNVCSANSWHLSDNIYSFQFFLSLCAFSFLGEKQSHNTDEN